MNPRPGPGPTQSARQRQIVYLLAIVVLLGVMVPFTNKLQSLKAEKDLGEATIGQIDSGSFLFKLAQLAGMRGVVADYLWNKAQGLQKAQDWDRLKTTVDFITQLQPHFLNVWSFQGWNLAYNVSVEWDAPDDKYTWIKEGIKFLGRGVKRNPKSPDLTWDEAWTYYHKLGFSDEAIVLRRLFRDDDDIAFRTYPDPRNPRGVEADDNFLLGYGWFKEAIRKADDDNNQRVVTEFEAPVEYVDRVEKRKGRPGDLHFRSMPGHARIKYAAALEKASIQGIPATFGERARTAWRYALDEWLEFGLHKFPMFRYEKEGRIVQLDDETSPIRFKALDDKGQHWTLRWGEQTHYPYWKQRCQAEMTEEGVRARRLFYEATRAFKRAEFPQAVEKYREGLDVWEKLLANYPIYGADDQNAHDTGLVVKRYLKALTNAGLDRPKTIPFEKLAKLVEFEENPDPFDEMEMRTVDYDKTAASR